MHFEEHTEAFSNAVVLHFFTTALLNKTQILDIFPT